MDSWNFGNLQRRLCRTVAVMWQFFFFFEKFDIFIIIQYDTNTKYTHQLQSTPAKWEARWNIVPWWWRSPILGMLLLLMCWMAFQRWCFQNGGHSISYYMNIFVLISNFPKTHSDLLRWIHVKLHQLIINYYSKLKRCIL